MSRRRRILNGALATLMACALLGCAGLPQNGPVQEGLTLEDEFGEPDFFQVPEKPIPNATQEQIVAGFLRAGSGTADKWATARLFLTPSAQQTWQPEVGVLIDSPGAERRIESSGDGQITVTLSSIATINDAGTYEAADGLPAKRTFTLVKVDGEWRIAEAPDGIVLNSDVFGEVFHQYSISYFDVQYRFLVPDVRWFPASNAPVRIAIALIEGEPSAWLAESVTNTFPDAVTLESPTVPVTAGTAQVSLNSAALEVDSNTLNLMYTQLSASLLSAGVADVTMLFGSTALPATAVPVASTRVSGQALVLTDQGFGFAGGDDIEPIPGLSSAVLSLDAPPQAIELSADRRFAGVRLRGGSVARVGVDGPTSVVDDRAALVASTVDPYGFIWTVPQDDPSAVRATSLSERREIAEAWPGVTTIEAMSISRDGARVAALVRVGSTPAIWVSGVIRDRNGVPERLGTPLPLASLSSDGTAVGWLDDVTLGALVGSDSSVSYLEQLVGGPGTEITAPEQASSLAGSTTAGAVWLYGADGTVHSRRSQNWLEQLTGVQVLATQQGIPAS